MWATALETKSVTGVDGRVGKFPPFPFSYQCISKNNTMKHTLILAIVLIVSLAATCSGRHYEKDGLLAHEGLLINDQLVAFRAMMPDERSEVLINEKGEVLR